MCVCVCVCVCVWTQEPSLIGIQYNSGGYWAFFMLGVFGLAALTIKIAFELKHEYQKKVALNYEFIVSL